MSRRIATWTMTTTTTWHSHANHQRLRQSVDIDSNHCYGELCSDLGDLYRSGSWPAWTRNTCLISKVWRGKLIASYLVLKLRSKTFFFNPLIFFNQKRLYLAPISYISKTRQRAWRIRLAIDSNQLARPRGGDSSGAAWAPRASWWIRWWARALQWVRAWWSSCASYKYTKSVTYFVPCTWFGVSLNPNTTS